jgi:DNA-binding winged helix-turn-helix (wHTH) protein
MMKNEPTPHYYEFDGFRLDLRKRLLLRDGEPVRLKSKAFALLLVLIERRTCVLEKDELMQAVWPDTTVEENNLTVHMSALRKALGERAGAPSYIVTIPGQGYRFTAEVRETPASSELIVARRARTRVVIEEETDEPAFGTLAVLPFKALGAQERDEYLELGLADALITHFSHLPQLILRPTSAVARYAGRAHDPVAAGRELGVDAVLDGRVQLVGDRLRLTVQLISIGNGALLWAEKFNSSPTSSPSKIRSPNRSPARWRSV